MCCAPHVRPGGESDTLCVWQASRERELPYLSSNSYTFGTRGRLTLRKDIQGLGLHCVRRDPVYPPKPEYFWFDDLVPHGFMTRDTPCIMSRSPNITQFWHWYLPLRFCGELVSFLLYRTFKVQKYSSGSLFLWPRCPFPPAPDSEKPQGLILTSCPSTKLH